MASQRAARRQLVEVVHVGLSDRQCRRVDVDAQHVVRAEDRGANGQRALRFAASLYTVIAVRVHLHGQRSRQATTYVSNADDACEQADLAVYDL